jgi:hypothetical protein
MLKCSKIGFESKKYTFCCIQKENGIFKFFLNLKIPLYIDEIRNIVIDSAYCPQAG